MLQVLPGLLLGAALCGAIGCREDKPRSLAPAASALASAAPVSEQSLRLVVEPSASTVRFLMEAPIEKIFGEAPASVEGELFVNVEDLSKSTGLLRVDLQKLALYQQKREGEKDEFGEKQKNDTQNEHARTWLEISDDTPAELRKENRFVEFRIARLESPSVASLGALSGAERKVTATAVGDFRLHGRKKEQRVKAELGFGFAGDKLAQVKVRTLEPLPVDLEAYDVRPREAFGKLAQKTLDALGSKVAKVAPIEVEFSARPQ
jgi:hypothetical protein